MKSQISAHVHTHLHYCFSLVKLRVLHLLLSICWNQHCFYPVSVTVLFQAFLSINKHHDGDNQCKLVEYQVQSSVIINDFALSVQCKVIAYISLRSAVSFPGKVYLYWWAFYSWVYVWVFDSLCVFVFLMFMCTYSYLAFVDAKSYFSNCVPAVMLFVICSLAANQLTNNI